MRYIIMYLTFDFQMVCEPLVNCRDTHYRDIGCCYQWNAAAMDVTWCDKRRNFLFVFSVSVIFVIKFKVVANDVYIISDKMSIQTSASIDQSASNVPVICVLNFCISSGCGGVRQQSIPNLKVNYHTPKILSCMPVK